MILAAIEEIAGAMLRGIEERVDSKVPRWEQLCQLIRLKNNPGIEVDRLEPFRAAEQTMIEKSVFDPILNLEFHKVWWARF